MSLKIGIHGQVTAFSSVWARLARQRGLEVMILDAHGAGFLDEVRACDAFLWHMNHLDDRDVRFGPAMMQALEETDIPIFPNAATARTFDDKLAQVRLFAAAGVSAPRSWCFLNADEAHRFVDSATWPLVFKLRGGAGSGNVRKVGSAREAHALIRRMFGRGMRASAVGLTAAGSIGKMAPRSRRSGREWIAGASRVLRRTLWPQRERNYALFQEFIPGCDHDIRVTVIGARAFVFRRRVRPNDFRASGSGLIDFLQPEEIPMDMVTEAFALSRRWGFQSMGYDFVRHPDGGIRLIEMCYVFVSAPVEGCPGYTDAEGGWIPGHYCPEELILDDLLASLDE